MEECPHPENATVDTCPYKVDIYDNDEECNCCDDCRDECADDI